ncbi:MAG TPA: carbon monoxide dehydrogenase subunit G [Dongiaceae bacterium]
MDLTGEYRIPAPREAVWKALNDPEILKQSIPGCESIEKLSDTEMTARVTARVGPVKASFSGKVTLSDLDPPNGYKIAGEGQGGVAGFAKGGADVRLKPDESGAGTILTYTATASVGGKLAQIGSRLIEGTSKQMADQFFGKLAEIVGAAAAPAQATATPAAAPATAPPPPAQRGMPPALWVGGLIAIVIVLLLIFGIDW